MYIYEESYLVYDNVRLDMLVELLILQTRLHVSMVGIEAQ